MNKLFTKIAALALGATMAVGVGVAVASSSKEATPVQAANSTYNLVSSLTANDEVLIVAKKSSTYYYLPQSNGSSSAPSASTVTVSSNSITGDYDAALFKVVANSTNWKFQSVATSTNFLYTTSANNGIRIGTNSNNIYTVTEQNSTNHYFQMKNTATNRYVGIYNTQDWRSYTSATQSNYGSPSSANQVMFFKKAAAKTLSSISVSGYTTSFTVGDAFSFGGTVTAHYSDSTTANVTSSATFSGYNMSTAGSQTVTVSYTEGGTTKTATYGITVSAPTTPTLSFDKASFSGYTGQSFSVTATYANLESDLAWSAVGDGSITDGNITWSSSDHRNGTSTYTCTLSGEGGKTIVADADGVDAAAQCGITIAQTTVDITKASTSIPVGRSETLAASHNASSVGGLNWTSSDNSIATVASDGKVTVDSNATVGDTVTITARSSVDTSVADTCTVTVAAAPLDTTYDFTTNFSTYASAWSGYGSKTLAGVADLAGDYAATVTLPYASKQGTTITTMPVVADQTSGDVIHISFELTASGYTLGDVSITFVQWGTKAPTMKLFKGTTASGDALDTGVIGTKNTISASDVGGTTFVVAMNDNSTSRNQVGVQSIYISLVRENKLDHVTVSFTSDPADRTFYAGSNFAFNGTLTASYTVDAAKAVTPASYHLNSESGTAITTSTILTVSGHNGKSVYVVYTEGGVTKSDSFTLVVNAAPATSVTLSSDSGSVALEEVFDVTSITATVNPSAYATQGVTWEVYDSDGLVQDSTYMYDGTEFYATEAAEVVFHVKANSNSSIYASFTLTITGEPLVVLKDDADNVLTNSSTTVFADVGDIYFEVTAENFQGTITYTWTSSNDSVISIDDGEHTSACMFLVETSGSARLSCHVQGSVKGNVTVYVDVTVSAVTVTSVTWNAPSINVYSGATLSTAGWNVKYSTDSGKTDQTPDSFDILLGGSVVSNGYAFKADDDGKTLAVRVGSTTSATTTTVSVTQSLQAVMADVMGEPTTKTWNASSGDLGSSMGSTAGVTDSGSLTFDDESTMSYTRTLEYLASGKSDYVAWSSPYIQFGSSNALETLELDVTNSNVVTQVQIYCWAKNGATNVTVTVGGVTFDSVKAAPSSAGSLTFSGSASGNIVITMEKASKTAGCAQYIASVAITTVESSGEQTNIANVAGHEAAQKAVVAFAKAMNAAFDDTENCTDGVAGAWATASSAYSSNIANNASLSADEKAYAKNLIKYADAEYTDDTDNDYSYCLERAMATYEACIQKHGQEAFMSDVRTVSASSRITLLSFINSNGNTVAIIVIISMISVTAIGGYFFLRKRKEN